MPEIHYISFPGLGIDYFRINPVAFSLFGWEVRWYGVILCAGIIAGFLYFLARAKKIGLSVDDALDFAIFTIPAAIIGARLYFVLTRLDEYESFYDAIAIWNGGIAMYGSVIGGFIAVALVCKYKKIKLPVILDAISPGVMLGQIIGRWGNFVNAEAYGTIDRYDFFGIVTRTPKLYETFPLRMNISGSPDGFFNIIAHPTFLYESVWNLIGFLLIQAYGKKKKFDGEIVLIYLAWYGFGRCLVEGLRQDSLWVGPIRISQLVGALCFAAGLLLIVPLRARAKRAAAGAGAYEKVFGFDAQERETVPDAGSAEQIVLANAGENDQPYTPADTDTPNAPGGIDTPDAPADTDTPDAPVGTDTPDAPADTDTPDALTDPRPAEEIPGDDPPANGARGRNDAKNTEDEED